MVREQTSQYGFYWHEERPGIWSYMDYLIQQRPDGYYEVAFWGPGCRSYLVRSELHHTFEAAEAFLDAYLRRLGAGCGY